MKKDVSDMDYEKAYKDALERARKIKHDVQSIGCTNIGYMMDVDMLELIFPELRESEDDMFTLEMFEYEKVITAMDMGAKALTQPNNLNP